MRARAYLRTKRRIRASSVVAVLCGIAIGVVGGILIPTSLRSGMFHRIASVVPGYFPMNGVPQSVDLWSAETDFYVKRSSSRYWISLYQVMHRSIFEPIYAPRYYVIHSNTKALPSWVRLPRGRHEIVSSAGYGFPLPSQVEYCIQDFEKEPSRVYRGLTLYLAEADVMRSYPATFEVAWSVWRTAVNIVAWALPLPVAFWLSRAASLALWRRIREWRGLCGGCGYSLQGIAPSVCPECGEHVRGASGQEHNRS